MILKQSVFPLLEEYKKFFDITEDTIFAYDGNIYTNNELPNHLIIHETEHLLQQEMYGLQQWVDSYLNDKSFRLLMEIEAYKAQLASIKDRNARNSVLLESARNLASPLYGNIISYEEALKLLK